jgi:hypothetical protein
MLWWCIKIRRSELAPVRLQCYISFFSEILESLKQQVHEHDERPRIFRRGVNYAVSVDIAEDAVNSGV